ncbi:MAG: hypothetical protein E7440_05705 [Ruminococcaceae bacterium]|nr:hypothetical protein [Oscillospiraceae bacterium]
MSRVMLIAADKPLPLCSHCEVRTKTVVVEGTSHTISFPHGFQLSDHSYYRSCVDGFGYSMKPYQYGLDLAPNETDLTHLKNYLSENFSCGEQAELWSLWVSDLPGRTPLRSRIPLSAFTMGSLEQLLNADDLCITVTI